MPFDRRILITGAGSGIGRALAIDAARRDATVYLCGRRLEKLEETLCLLKRGKPHMAIAADISVEADRQRIHHTLASQYRGLDMLVNNAGVVTGGALELASSPEIERMFETNIIAPVLLTRQLLPLLAAGRSPRVVNVGSMFGEIPFAEFAAYSSSKAAMKAFSIALRRELKPAGIAVTYAAPRGTDTDAASAVAHLNGAKAPKLDHPDHVAARIWDAVDLGKNTVYPPGPERFFILLQALLPGLLDRALSSKPKSKSPPAIVKTIPRKKEMPHASQKS